jgi:hypothetical protein
VRRELVTTAAILDPIMPPMDRYSASEYVEKKMVDFAMGWTRSAISGRIGTKMSVVACQLRI